MSDWVIDPWCFGGAFEIVGLACDSDLGSVGVPPSVTVSDPAEAVNGDLIILQAVVKNDNAIDAGSWTVNAIWNELVAADVHSGGADTKAAVWYRFKDAGDPATNDVDFSTGDADLYVCQYVVKNANSVKPMVYAYHADELSGTNQHYVGRCELQPNTVQVVWFAMPAAATIDSGSSNLPPTVLKNGSDEHGWLGYKLLGASDAAEITAYNLRTTVATNYPWLSYQIVAEDVTTVGAGSRPTGLTDDVDVIFDTGVFKDAGVTPATFLTRPSTELVDQWNDQSGNANHLTMANANSIDNPALQPPAGILLGHYNSAVGGGITNVVNEMDIPQLNATVTSLEIMLICTFADFDTVANDGRTLFKYNNDSFRCELEWNGSSATLDAVLYNSGAETGRATITTTEVPTLPYGRHVIIATFDPSSEVTLRVDAAENADVTVGVTAQSGSDNVRRLGGTSSITATDHMNGLSMHEMRIWVNQTLLTGVEKGNLETYAFNEYNIVDRS